MTTNFKSHLKEVRTKLIAKKAEVECEEQFEKQLAEHLKAEEQRIREAHKAQFSPQTAKIEAQIELLDLFIGETEE